MCNCISDIEVMVLDKMKEDKKAFGVVNKASFKNIGYSFGANGGEKLYNEVEYEMTNKKKDGSIGATKNYRISIYHTYCPFCGEKLIKDEEEKTDA